MMNLLSKIAVVVCASYALAGSAQDMISTVVGGGPNGIPALNANLSQPREITFDTQGNYYFAAQGISRIYKVSSSGIVSIVAGNGFVGYSGDGGPAVDAEVNNPNSVAIDSDGNVYIGDSGNCLIRKVTISTGVISTIAGLVTSPTTTSCGFSGDGGEAIKAQLNIPAGIVLSPKTNDIYFADNVNGRVRKIAGGSPSGTITTVAGGGGSTTSSNACGGSPPYGDGAAATEAYLCYPQSIAIDASVSPANIFVDEFSGGGRCTVREIVGSSGNIYRIAGTYNTCGFVDNTAATSAEFNNPWQIGVSKSGSTTTVDVVDTFNERIRQFSITYSAGVPQPGKITTVAGSGSGGYCGDGGKALSACLYYPIGAASDSAGNLFIGDYNNDRIREVTKSTGDISTVVGWGYNGNTVTNYSDPVGIKNDVGQPALDDSVGVYADPGSSSVYVSEAFGNAVYVLDTSNSEISNFAGDGIAGFAGDGSAATAATTELNQPAGMTKDSHGNVYIADASNCVIREVEASSGDITTIAGVRQAP